MWVLTWFEIDGTIIRKGDKEFKETYKAFFDMEHLSNTWIAHYTWEDK